MRRRMAAIDPSSHARIVQRNGRANVRRVGGRPKRLFQDLFHAVLVAPWLAYIAGLVGLLLGFNLLFAGLYLFQPGSIDGARAGSWQDAFFFSVETFATVGYGVMHPATLFGHVLATAEIICGMLGVALATGLTYAKFTRPKSNVLFSNVATIAVFDGCPTLMFRAANLRANQIVEAQVRVTLVRPGRTPEGYDIRRFIDLDLVRKDSPVFALTWTVMHRIDERSPLFGADAAVLAAMDAEIIAVVTGIDETSSSLIHARHSFRHPEIVLDEVFDDVIRHADDGLIHIDYRLFHATRPATVLLAETRDTHAARHQSLEAA